MAQLLRDVDVDEVSPVKRGANRKRVILKEDGEVQVGPDIAAIMEERWEHEGAMIDELQKADADDTVVRSAVGAMRLLAGIADELPPHMREAVAKLGTEMYPRANPKLNTSGVPSPGELDGSSSGAPRDGRSGKQTDLEGPGRDGELTGTGSAPKVAQDDDCDTEPDDDADEMTKSGVWKFDADSISVAKDAKTPYGNVTYADPGYQSDGIKRYPIDTERHIRAAWSYINQAKNAAKYSSGQVASIKSKIRAAMKRIGADVSKEDTEIAVFVEANAGLFDRVLKAMRRKPKGEGPGEPEPDEDPDDDEPDDDDTSNVEKGGTVGTHAVPIQKEDGSWDLSGVPDDARAFYQHFIQKADETSVKLEKAESDLAETRDQLRTAQIVKKADTDFAGVAPRDDMVELLKSAETAMSPDDYERLETVLKTANARISEGRLFSELGYTGGTGIESGGDAWAKIEKAADDMVEKSDTLTKDQAVDRVLKTPEGARLYSDYMRESGLGVS